MRKAVILTILTVTGLSSVAMAQQGTTFTGTAVIYGSGMNTRTTTRTFKLFIKAKTTPGDASRFLSELESGGQNGLLKAMEGQDLGRFSFSGNVGEALTGVLVDQVEAGTRIRAVFRRWIGFGELRGGYRSIDYPFGYVEIILDPVTGKGDGTIIPAARIRFKSAKNAGADTVEIEDFGTFPGRLIGVQMRGMKIS